MKRLILRRLLNNKLSKRFLKILKIAGRIADDLGYQAYLVGGPVRDILLGRKNIDMDIVIEGEGIKFAKNLASKLKKNVTIYSNFGTSTIRFSNGDKLDIATARCEKYPYPGSLPQVSISDIKQDLKRRDFTINAMAIKINPDSFGELIDYFGGLEDLNRGEIRILHDRSFFDDPTRILRAVRFEQRYNFSIHKATLAKLIEASKKSYLSKVSPQRIINELKLIFKEENPKVCIRRLNELCSLEFIHPKIKFSNRDLNFFDKIKSAIDWYNCLKKNGTFELWLIYFLALIDELKIEEIKKICKKYNLRKENSQTFCLMKKFGEEAVKLLNSKQKPKPSITYQILSKFSEEALIYLVAKSDTIRSKRRIRDYEEKLKKIKLNINGDNLKSLGITPGPSFSKILKATLLAKIDRKIKNKKEELKFIKNKFKIRNVDRNINRSTLS